MRPGHVNVLPKIGALSEWHREVHAKVRTRYEFDALWEAACAEANARDALREGLPEIANDYRRQAAEILMKAATAGAA